MDRTDFAYGDIRPDGKRFPMPKDPGAEVPGEIDILVNRSEEPEQRAPKE